MFGLFLGVFCHNVILWVVVFSKIQFCVWLYFPSMQSGGLLVFENREECILVDVYLQNVIDFD